MWALHPDSPGGAQRDALCDAASLGKQAAAQQPLSPSPREGSPKEASAEGASDTEPTLAETCAEELNDAAVLAEEMHPDSGEGPALETCSSCKSMPPRAFLRCDTCFTVHCCVTKDEDGQHCRECAVEAEALRQAQPEVTLDDIQ